jgi:cyclophilin family peptidyl-prolyl cis-trans isomerase
MMHPRTWWKSSRPTARAHRPQIGRSRRPRFEHLETRLALAAPTLVPIDDVTLLSGSPLVIPLDGFDPDGDTLSFTATSDNASVTTSIPEGNRSMKISVHSADGAIDGDMILELLEDRVPRVTSRIIELAQSGFYDGIIFHRVIDGFMVQTGDPTGTGEGGSPLPDFDDQFDFDLQHNSTGVLSMAKSGDDTNNSQFFIVDTPTDGVSYPRHLDYNHSIFGHLVEGFDVLEDISAADTGDDTQPEVDIVMQSVQIFVDNENGVLMLEALDGYTGEANITVTADDGHGGQTSVPFHVTITPDTIDADPYLSDVPEIRTPVDTAKTFYLTANDVEGNTAYFLDDYALRYSSVAIPLYARTNLDYAVDFYTGQVDVAPTGGLAGIHPITVATGVYVDAIDYEVVPIFIVPTTAPTAQLDMTLVRTSTEVDAMGEVAALPADQWIDEWDSFSIEVWATVTQAGEFGVHTVSTDLNFDSDLWTATKIEFGDSFAENRSGQIDNAAGKISDLGGTTHVFTINGYPDIYPNSPIAPEDVNLYGDQRPVLVARVYFEPKPDGSGIPLGATTGYMTPQTDLGFTFTNAQVLWSSVDATTLTTGTLHNAELWPVMYDLDDDGAIGLGDLSYFAAAYNHAVGAAGVGHTWASDFNHNGEVDLGDLSYFASVYGRGPASPGRLNYAASFPTDWRPATEAAALLGGGTGGEGAAGDSSEAAATASGSPELIGQLAFVPLPASPHHGHTAKDHVTDAVDLVIQLYDPRR